MQLIPLGVKFPAFIKDLFVKYAPIDSVKRLKVIRDEFEATARTVLETRRAEFARGELADEDKLGRSGVDLLSNLCESSR